MCMWNTLSKDVQDIVWYFCGDLRDARNRYHKFVGLELKVWQMLLGAPIQPSYLIRQYRTLGVDRLKHILELAYAKAQREAFAKETHGTWNFLGGIAARIETWHPDRPQPASP